jgi:hypothetical protein
MATKRKIYLPSIANIGAGSAANTVGLVDLPLYYKYHAIGIEYVDGGASPQDIANYASGSLATGVSGTPGAGGLIGDIALKINTNVTRIHSAIELDHLNVVNGTIYGRQALGAGANMKQVLVLNFAEPWRITAADRVLTAANLTPTFGVNSAQIQITLGAAMPATGSLVLYAVVEPPDTAVPTQWVSKQVLRQQIAASGTAIDITTLPMTGYYQTLEMRNPTGACIGKATLKVNGTAIRELLRDSNVAELVRQGMNPANSSVAGAFGYDLILDDDDPVNSALPAGGQNFQLHLDFYNVNGAATAATASGNITALIELLQINGW